MHILAVTLTVRVHAQIQEYAVQVSAEAFINPPHLVFSWPKDPAAKEYYIFRKEKEDTGWGLPVAVLDGNAAEFIDSNLLPGQAYEYGFYKTLAVQQQTIQVENGRSLRFKITDSWRDGICCIHGFGNYQIYGKDKVYAQGGAFLDSEIKTFLVDGGNGTTHDSIVVNIQLDVFAGETTWTLTDQDSETILAQGGPYEGIKYGHVFAGIEQPAIEFRGTLVLLIEHEIADELQVEVERLKQDLICDGWKVRDFVVDKKEEVTKVKQIIKGVFVEEPLLEAVFILGHVPVPYSGDVMSAHSDHCGAYPADVYYGEMDGQWTDYKVNDATARRKANHNVPGDGKFDQTYLPSDVDLQIGRVDLSNLTVFDENEIELTRLYLQKNHDYRRGKIQIGRRGLIDNNLGEMDGMAVGAIGFRNFASLFGSSNIKEQDYFSTLDHISYLWSQGCGGGSYTSCSGVGSSSNFATNKVQSVFTMLYGSYFGDWDNENNLLRASIASQPSLLVSMWAGAPAWHLHHMALGETIGYSTRISQNNSTLYAPSDRVRQIHVALMGDPTLRLHTVLPPGDLVARPDGNAILLEWTPSPENVLGYYLYRAENTGGEFIRLNDVMLTGTLFKDIPPQKGDWSYMVRAVKLEYSGGGSYYNLSQGIMDSASNSSALMESCNRVCLSCFPNPSPGLTNLTVVLARTSRVNIDLLNMHGKVVNQVFYGELPSGKSDFQWNGDDHQGNCLPSGIYMCRCITSDQSPVIEKLLIIR